MTLSEPVSEGNLPVCDTTATSQTASLERPPIFKPGDIAWVHTKNVRIFKGNDLEKLPRSSWGGGPHPVVIIRPYGDDSFMCAIGSHRLKPKVYKNLCAANDYMKLTVEKFQRNTMISLGTPVIAYIRDLEPSDNLKYPESPTKMDIKDFKMLLYDLQNFPK